MLPPNFTFTQSSLQAYKDCARRFWLAYIQQLPVAGGRGGAGGRARAADAAAGSAFTGLVERTGIGLDPEQVAAQIDPVDDPDLAAQFDAWLEHRHTTCRSLCGRWRCC